MIGWKGWDFTGRVTLVIGGAEGIGKAVAELLCERGAKVALLDRDAAAVRSLARGILGLVGEVHDQGNLAAVVQSVSEQLGQIDLLCNVAESDITGSVLELGSECWAKAVGANMTGVMLASRAVLPGMLQAGRGVIVNVASIHAIAGWPALAADCATMGGMIQLTRQMAVDFGALGIRVNAVCPGITLTPAGEARLASLTAAERGAMRNRHLLGRFAIPREIAQAVAWLASDAATFVTGAVLPVDGGYTSK